MNTNAAHAMASLARLSTQTKDAEPSKASCPWCRDGRQSIAGFHGGTFHTIDSPSGFVECWNTVGETVSGEHNHYGV